MDLLSLLILIDACCDLRYHLINLFLTAVKSVSNQLAAGVVPEEVELTKESKYTQQIIVDAVEEILEEQGAANQTVK